MALVASKYVAETHALQTKMGQISALVAHQSNPELLKEFIKLRIGFLQEEVNELKLALEESDADKAVDAVVDGIVVGIDTLLLMQVDVDESWDRVYERNFSKVPGVNPNRPNPFGLPDLIKPEGFIAPTHVGNLGLFEQALQ